MRISHRTSRNRRSLTSVYLTGFSFFVSFAKNVHSFSVYRSQAATRAPSALQSGKMHDVGGVECVEVSLDVNGEKIIVLEANASAQNRLVDEALEEDGSLQDPYGAVLWPAALAVAKYIHKDNIVRDRTVLELGTGTGLVSIAAASLCGAKTIMATDYEQLPLKIVDYAQNLNQISSIDTGFFDICDETLKLIESDVVIAADIMYEPATGKAMARRVVEALRNNSRVIVGDSPGRAGRPAFLEELKLLGVDQDFESVDGTTVTGERHELICGPTSTTVTSEPQRLTVAIMDLLPSVLPVSK